MSGKIFGAIFLDTLNISVASVCKFRVHTETDLSHSSNSSKFEILLL